MLKMIAYPLIFTIHQQRIYIFISLFFIINSDNTLVDPFLFLIGKNFPLRQCKENIHRLLIFSHFVVIAGFQKNNVGAVAFQMPCPLQIFYGFLKIRCLRTDSGLLQLVRNGIPVIDKDHHANHCNHHCNKENQGKHQPVFYHIGKNG